MPGLRLMAELGLDGSGFEAGFKRAEGLAHGVAHGIKDFVVEAVGVGAIGVAISKTVETAKELIDTSERLAVAPEQLQVLRQAAKDSNLEFDKMAEAFEKIDIARQRAFAGGPEGIKALRAFGGAGITTDILRNQTAAQLFTGPLANLARNRNPEEIGVIFRDLGIKAFGGLIPVLKTNFDELGKQMKKMGAIMDTETAVKLKHLGDELSLISQIVLAQLGPALVKLIETLYEGILKLGKTVAGASGFFGAGTAGMGAGGTVGTLLKTAGYGAVDIYERLFHGRTAAESKAFLESKLQGAGFNLKEARGAADKAEQPWLDKLNQFAAMLEKFRRQAEELDHPKTPDLSQPAEGLKLTKKELETPTDSLVRIGNFFGSGQQTAMNSLAQRRTQLLQKIADNTRSLAQLKPGHGAGVGGTYFPMT